MKDQAAFEDCLAVKANSGAWKILLFFLAKSVYLRTWANHSLYLSLASFANIFIDVQ